MQLSDFSTSDLIRELIDRKEVLSVTVWTTDNIRDRLHYLVESNSIKNIDITDSLIEEIRESGYWDNLGEESVADWDIIDDAIMEVVNEDGTY